MGKKAKESRFARFPAWAMSILTLLVLFIFLAFLEDPKSDNSLSTFQIIGYIICAVFITVACFIICRIHPKSVWYTPIICNAVSIIALIVFVFTDMGALWEFIFWMGILVLSSIGAIVGANIGRRKSKPIVEE
jgi:amino acid transporter